MVAEIPSRKISIVLTHTNKKAQQSTTQYSVSCAHKRLVDVVENADHT